MTLIESGAYEAPNTPIDVLKEDLFGIYYACGRNVTYVTDDGRTRNYWPNRYLQALKRAVEAGDAEVVALVVRMVTGEPTRGFGYLADAERLDLTVEALVADPSKPYHHLFDAQTVEAARRRLAQYGFQAGAAPAAADGLASALVRTEQGMAVELTVECTANGDVLLHAGDHIERADGTLDAAATFVGLLAQAEAGAQG